MNNNPILITPASDKKRKFHEISCQEEQQNDYKGLEQVRVAKRNSAMTILDQ